MWIPLLSPSPFQGFPSISEEGVSTLLVRTPSPQGFWILLPPPSSTASSDSLLLKSLFLCFFIHSFNQSTHTHTHTLCFSNSEHLLKLFPAEKPFQCLLSNCPISSLRFTATLSKGSFRLLLPLCAGPPHPFHSHSVSTLNYFRQGRW